MLILTRKPNESIIIDNNIKVTILEVEYDRVKIGITAPKEVPVHREEIQRAITNERQVRERVRRTSKNNY